MDVVIDGRWWHAVGATAVARRIPPDGCVDLIAMIDGDRIAAYIYGPTARYDDVTLPPGTILAGVRFRAGGGPLALGVRGDDLRDRSVALDQVAPRAARRLGDTAPTVHAVRAQLDRIAADLARSARPRAEHERTARAVAALDAGATRIAAVARDVGTCERNLRRDFLCALGLTPKAFARVARARRAADALAAGASPGRVALACGYADQAHLTRELGELHGVTPSNVRKLQDGAAAPA